MPETLSAEAKQCPCCGAVHNATSWSALRFVGEQLTEDETGKYRLELRDCTCGSTIGIETCTTNQTNSSTN